MPDSQVRDDFVAGRAAAPQAAADAQWQQLIGASSPQPAASAGSAQPDASAPAARTGDAGAEGGSGRSATAAPADQSLPFGLRVMQALQGAEAPAGAEAEGEGWKAIGKYLWGSAQHIAQQSAEDQATRKGILDGTIPPDDARVSDMHHRMVDQAIGFAFPPEALGGEAGKSFMKSLGGVVPRDVIEQGMKDAATEAAPAASPKPAMDDSGIAKPGEAGSDEAAGAGAEKPPPYQFNGPDGPTLKVTPEIRAQFTDWANGKMGDNPVQASLAQVADPKVFQETLDGVASFVPKMETVPDETLRRVAYQSAMQPEDVLGALTGHLPDARKLVAWSTVQNSGALELGTLAQKAVEAGAGTPEWEAATRAYALQNHLVSEWERAGSEQGLAFHARQIQTLAQDDYSKTVKDIIARVGPQNMEDAIRKIAALKTPEQISGLASAWRWATSRDGMLTTWYNYLLGPKTVVKKAATDLTMPIWNLATRYAAEKFGSGAIADGETAALLHGYTGAFGDALRAGGRGLMAGRSQFMSDFQTMDGFTKTRLSLLANGSELGAQGAATQPTHAALAYLRAALPTSWIAGVDDFAKTFHYRAELRAGAYRELSAKGLEGADLGGAINDAVANPSPALHSQALQKAQEMTFTEPLTGVAEAFANGIDKINIPIRGTSWELPAGRIMVPFFRTPTNFARFMYRQSPAPLLFPSQAFKAEIAAGGASRDLAYAKIGLGTGVATTFAGLAMSGMITGRGPSNPGMNDAWQRAGNRPYMVRWPGTEGVQLPIEPFAMHMGAIADTVDLLKFAKDADGEQVAMSAVLGIGHAFLSRTYMQSLSDAMEAFQHPDTDGQRWSRNLAASLAVPRGIADIAGAIDPWQRAHYSLLQAIEAKLPFVSQNLPHARTLWGDPIPLPDAYLPGLSELAQLPGQSPAIAGMVRGAAHVASPFTLGPTGDQVQPIDKWIWENRASFPAADEGRIGLMKPGLAQSYSNDSGLTAHVRLTPQQLDRLQALAGNELKDKGTGLGAKDMLNALVEGNGPRVWQDQWDKASDGERALMVLNAVSKARNGARQELINPSSPHYFPDIRDAVNAGWATRKEVLAPSGTAGGAAPRIQ